MLGLVPLLTARLDVLYSWRPCLHPCIIYSSFFKRIITNPLVFIALYVSFLSISPKDTPCFSFVALFHTVLVSCSIPISLWTTWNEVLTVKSEEKKPLIDEKYHMAKWVPVLDKIMVQKSDEHSLKSSCCKFHESLASCNQTNNQKKNRLKMKGLIIANLRGPTYNPWPTLTMRILIVLGPGTVVGFSSLPNELSSGLSRI